MNGITITDGNFTSPEFYMERLNGRESASPRRET
jgi:hypothetical protein